VVVRWERVAQHGSGHVVASVEWRHYSERTDCYNSLNATWWRRAPSCADITSDLLDATHQHEHTRIQREHTHTHTQHWRRGVDVAVRAVRAIIAVSVQQSHYRRIIPRCPRAVLWFYRCEGYSYPSPFLSSHTPSFSLSLPSLFLSLS